MNIEIEREEDEGGQWGPGGQPGQPITLREGPR